ncbi:hypothetical protein B7494_g8374 [Chlorociboria aeruginascens]|nr:hypothetical protein B7494_g8374 [Chlorociboria aeruginascens]
MIGFMTRRAQHHPAEGFMASCSSPALYQNLPNWSVRRELRMPHNQHRYRCQRAPRTKPHGTSNLSSSSSSLLLPPPHDQEDVRERENERNDPPGPVANRNHTVIYCTPSFGQSSAVAANTSDSCGIRGPKKNSPLNQHAAAERKVIRTVQSYLGPAQCASAAPPARPANEMGPVDLASDDWSMAPRPSPLYTGSSSHRSGNGHTSANGLTARQEGHNSRPGRGDGFIGDE